MGWWHHGYQIAGKEGGARACCCEGGGEEGDDVDTSHRGLCDVSVCDTLRACHWAVRLRDCNAVRESLQILFAQQLTEDDLALCVHPRSII